MPRPKKQPNLKPLATSKTNRRNNTQYDPTTGRLVNTPCPICELASRDPLGHLTKRGNPACRGHLRSGKPCGREPMRGQNVCMMHGGKVPHNMAAGKRRLALVAIRDELDGLGGSIDVDPAMAMLAMVREAAFNVAWLRSQLAILRQGFESGRGAMDGLLVQPDPESFAATQHVLLEMYDRERDRLVRYSKMCRDAGVEERRVKIEEEQGRWLTKTLDLLLERLVLTPQQQEALPLIMREVIDVLEAGERDALLAPAAPEPEPDEDEEDEEDDDPPQATGIIPAPTPPGQG